MLDKRYVLLIVLVGLLFVGGVFVGLLSERFGEHNFSLGYEQGVTDTEQSSFEAGFYDGNFSGWNQGYSLGYSDGLAQGVFNGNETGYLSGYESGYMLGDSEGYTKGYTKGYFEGNSSGYSDGYVVGEENGFSEGNVTGFNLGYIVGVEVGEDVGFMRGNSSGYSDGYVVGEKVGYDQGIKDGAGAGYNIRNPTFAEMQAFLAADTTDQDEYNDDYVCWNFVADVKQNAYDQGYRCGFVYIEFPYSAHAIVCFDTVDQGLVFVEPQHDDIVSLTIGEYYSNSNGFVPTWWDDTIVTYVVIW